MRFKTGYDSICSVRIKHLLPVILFSTLLLITGCRMVIGTDSALEIVVKGDHFTLAWDQGKPEIPNDPGRIVAYNVYYRNHGSYNWYFLKKTEFSNNTECLITDKDMSYGIYDFAVSSISEQGNMSALHSSLDRTADPFCGWYINWIGTK